MAHALILGMTESGKTTLGKWIAARMRASGRRILVLDPLMDRGWNADFITNDPAQFLETLFHPDTRGCAAFLDEGGLTVGRYNTAMQVTATLSRHWGHACHYLSQEATQLAPIIRAQCSAVYAFCMAARHGKLLAEEFNAPLLERCSELRRFEYISASRFGIPFTNSEVIKNGTRKGSDDRGRGARRNRRTVDSGGKKASQAGDGTSAPGDDGDTSNW